MLSPRLSFEPLGQQVGPGRVLSLKKDDQPFSVFGENAPEHSVEIRMDLEQRLGTEVDVVGVGKREVQPSLSCSSAPGACNSTRR